MKPPELSHHQWWHILDILRDEGRATGIALADEIQYDKGTGRCRLCEEHAIAGSKHRCWYPEVSDDDGALMVKDVQAMLTGAQLELTAAEQLWKAFSIRQRGKLVAAFNAMGKA